MISISNTRGYALGICLLLVGCKDPAMEEAARVKRAAEIAERARMQKQEQVLSALRRQFPRFRYLPWPGFGSPAQFDAPMTRSLVRSVQFKRRNGATAYDVSVWMTGNQPQPTAPAVYVTLLDDAGRVICREDVVDFLSATLSPGETRRVDYQMEVPPGVEPAFVAIDEDKKVGPAPMR